MHLLFAQLAGPARSGRRGSLVLRGLVERLDVRWGSEIASLARAELVVLIVAPEEDVAPPVCVVVREFGRAA